MKKLIYSLFIFAFIILPLNVFAASGTINIIGSSNVVIGNNVTFTVRLSSDTSLVSWAMNLSYDKNYLKLISTTSEAGGTKMANSSATGVTRKDYTFTFKALKTGSTTLSVNSYEAISFDTVSEIPLSSNSKTTKIITKEELYASYSKDNYLKNLVVEGYEISPEFNKDTLDYTVTVPEDTKEIKVTAYVNDSKSSVDGEGTLEVTSGTNKFNIIVKAQNGDEKTYTLTVEVKDSNPIEVEVDNVKYTVVKLKENLTLPSTYEETTVKINEFDIPAFVNKTVNITLVGLKDTEGNIQLFKYNEGKYEKYKQYTFGNITIYPLEMDEKIDNYKSDKITIEDYEIECLTLSKDSKFKVLKGVNLESGDIGLYLFDLDNQNLIKYDDELIKILENKNQMLVYAIIVFIGCTILSFTGLIICLKKKNNKNNKKTKEIKKVIENNEIIEKEENQEKNEIIEENITDEEEYYNIFEDENSKKKSKKTKKNK